MDPTIWLHFFLLSTTGFLVCWGGLVKSISQSSITSKQATVSSQSNPTRPDLGCILFGEAGCSISCTVMCDMYGCFNFDAICVDEISCECNETYKISSSVTKTTDYSRLSFNKLWNYKINKSKISQKIRKKIFQYPETFDEILRILRDPHKTGLHVKRRLQDLQPKWINVLKLEPRQLGYIDNLIEGEQFDDDGLKEYLENKMESVVDEMYDQLQETKLKLKPDNIPEQVDKEGKIKRMKTLAKSLNKTINSGAVTIYDTDQLILASVMKKLLDITENNPTEDVNGSTGMKKQFNLGEEMNVGQEDLFDQDFDGEEDTEIFKSFALSDEMTVGKDDLYDEDFGRSIQNSESESQYERTYMTDQPVNYQYKFNEPPNPIVYNNNNNNNNGNNNDITNNNNNNGYYSSYYDNYYSSVQGNSYFNEPPLPPNYPPGGYVQSNNYYTYNYQYLQDETRKNDENYTEISRFQVADDDDEIEINTNTCCEGYSSSWTDENIYY